MVGAFTLHRAEATTQSQWIAKPTGRTTCGDGSLRTHSVLSAAIQELEQSDVEVVEAKVARLAGRLSCMSCDCPDGSYTVLKVLLSDQSESVLHRLPHWERLAPNEIIPENANLSIFEENQGPQ